ncbi:uncharacterized protein CIMG_11012 [Coccidioides immitis RS]|uniref:Myb-like domain-containing protein n=1 Tax=Coccidioides immitis (strain RS) TaxID=246410 RepID=A0A0D8JRP1_COCIM|nr:uncharacterized protein CIMG_11012 [Coccidioides immitis RS]KJF59957.1 hypothetical protein CIMG_11012 [Coccidioides immitis RS]
MLFSINIKPYIPSASQSQAQELIPPSSMPHSESPEHGHLYPHDPLQVTPNSPQIVACNTQHPTSPDEPPLLEKGATGPSLSSPSTVSLDSSLEEFPQLPVLQNNDNILIDPAILANGRLWEITHPTLTKAQQIVKESQFLSWLFEGALASCTPEFNEGVQSAACLDYQGEIGPTQHGPSKGKKGNRGKQLWQWSPEDDAQLLSMIEDRQSWPEIEKCFPGRMESALRQRQSTLRKRRNRRGLDPARYTTNTHVSVASSPRPDTPAVAASAVDSPAHTSQKQPPTSPRPPRYPRVEVVIPTRLPHSRSTSP